MTSSLPSSWTLPRKVSGIGWRCSTTRVGWSLLLLFHAIHTPSADTIRAAIAMTSPRAIHRRRVWVSDEWLIVHLLRANGGGRQAPSFAQADPKCGPSRPAA